VIKKILIIAFLSAILGCNRLPENQLEPSNSALENQDILIDSLKWLAYAIRFIKLLTKIVYLQYILKSKIQCLNVIRL
jgi:hypothetical protein